MILRFYDMDHAVIIERQTRDCDVKCQMAFLFQWKFHIYGTQVEWKTKMTFWLNAR